MTDLKLDKSVIREVFLKHGFSIKEGQTDLKAYVYEAAEALIEAFVNQEVPDDSVTTRNAVSKNPGAAINIINQLKRRLEQKESELDSFKEQFWWWQNDSYDEIGSMVDSLLVVIKAGDLRELINAENKKLVGSGEYPDLASLGDRVESLSRELEVVQQTIKKFINQETKKV